MTLWVLLPATSLIRADMLFSYIVCVLIYIYIHMSGIYIYTSTHTLIHRHTHTCAAACMCTYIHILYVPRRNTNVCMYVDVYVYIYVYIYKYVLYACSYLYVCTYFKHVHKRTFFYFSLSLYVSHCFRPYMNIVVHIHGAPLVTRLRSACSSQSIWARELPNLTVPDHRLP